MKATLTVGACATMLWAGTTFASPPRGTVGDHWADVVVGKPDFSEINPNATVSNRLWLPPHSNGGGVIVDRTATPNRMYVYDSGNNRILGLGLGDTCFSSSTNPLGCSADLVIGQPNMNTSACNGDSGFQLYPARAPASAGTLCLEQESQLSVSEGASNASMAIDLAGSLYVTDFVNHRVLKYLSPFTTDTIADDVWGQGNFTGNACNRGMASPDATSLCFAWANPVGQGDNPLAGVDIDSLGNLWVVDSGNNRVLRFPQGLKAADLVLGQASFNTDGAGNGLSQFHGPAAVRINSAGRVYVSDAVNNRVLYFDPPLSSGMSGQVFASTSDFLQPRGMDVDPTQAGLWIGNFGHRTFERWDEGTQTKVQTIAMWTGGGIGIDSGGDLFISGGDQSGSILHDVVKIAKSDPSTHIRLFGNSGPGNLVTNYALGELEQVVVAHHPSNPANDQLIALDGRILFWNNPLSLANGQVADGVLPLIGSYINSITTDQTGHLYAYHIETGGIAHPEIWVYQTPLSSSSQPTKISIGSLPLLGGAGAITHADWDPVWGLAATPGGDFLWLIDSGKSRVVRIRNPRTNPEVDVVLGQTDSVGSYCNQDPQNRSSVTAPGNTLCWAGSVALDHYGNVWVSDDALEAQGNFRLLEFSASLFDTAAFQANGNQVIYGPSASKIFPKMATWQPAFDSQNRMVVGFNPYPFNPSDSPNPDGWRFPAIYDNPLAANPRLPDGYLNDFYSQAFSAVFDANDNLYVGDLNRSRILIYKFALANSQTCTSAAQCGSGFCVDGVCCNSACGDEITTDCQACSVAAGGVSDGTCTPITGKPCNDGNACTQTDTCQNGACIGTNPVACVPLDQCHDGTCNTGTGLCSNQNKPDSSACNDSNACTQIDTCQGGTCTGANPVVCAALDQCHIVGTCNTGTGTCSNPAKPNGTACNDGDGCPADSCQSGACQPVGCPNVDAVVLPGKPLKVTIASNTTSVTKTLSIAVRNADTVDRTIALSVDASACPSGMAGALDFDPTTPTVADTSIMVPAGKTKKAKLPLTINSSDFASFNFKAPARCTLLFTASAAVLGGSNDPNPSNNAAVVELSVIDKNDPEQTVTHETTIKSARPTSLSIGIGKTTGTKKLTAAVGNADYKPTAENPGDAITLSASTACTGLTLSTPICDPLTTSATVTVKGGTTKSCKLTATANASQITTANQKSPQRCRVTLTATGPSNPQMSPLDGSNNSTELVIDVLDKND